VAAETKFTIDGKEYQIPSIDTFDLDESQILFDYTRLTLADFVDDDDVTPEEREERERKFEGPGLVRALVHIAYRREHLDRYTETEIKKRVGAANFVNILAEMALSSRASDKVGDGRPPELPTSLGSMSSSSEVEKNGSSGPTSPTPSETQGDRLENTGTPESDMSYRESLPTMSDV